jgi:1-acyl-sn-glycerol-3-phosphate acyltransferase
MQKSLPGSIWHGFLRFLATLTAVIVFRIRAHDRQRVPPTGGGLLLANHQSNLDPIVIGLATKRKLNYLARQTLFAFGPLRWLMQSLDAIAIDREGTGLGGIKETLKRLKRGEMVLMFPEGTRTPDGEVQPLKPGFTVLAKRARVPLVPVAIDGTFDAWPRQQRLPRSAVIHVQFGEPIDTETAASMSDAELSSEVERRIRECHAQARRARELASGIGNVKSQAAAEVTAAPPPGQAAHEA